MYLYGASGHAKVIMDILKSLNLPIEGLIDDNLKLHEVCGIPVFHENKGFSPLIISIGNNSIRKKIASHLHVEFGTVVHPTAILSPSVRIGEGSVVMQGAILQAEVEVGRHCIINTGASVDHEGVIGDYVHLSPHVTLCGNVHVGEGTWIGAGATVIQGVKIGKWCIVGAGTLVRHDIPDGVMVVGNDCRMVRNVNQDLF